MPWIGPGRMIATSTTRSSRFAGFDFGSVCIWARLSTWKTPTVSAAWSIWKTSGTSSGSLSRSTQAAQSCSISCERLVDRGQHAEAEQVELDQLERLDVALVELDDDPVRPSWPAPAARCRSAAPRSRACRRNGSRGGAGSRRCGRRTPASAPSRACRRWSRAGCRAASGVGAGPAPRSNGAPGASARASAWRWEWLSSPWRSRPSRAWRGRGSRPRGGRARCGCRARPAGLVTRARHRGSFPPRSLGPPDARLEGPRRRLRHSLRGEPGDARRRIARPALFVRPDRPPPRQPPLLLRGRTAAEIDCGTSTEASVAEIVGGAGTPAVAAPPKFRYIDDRLARRAGLSIARSRHAGAHFCPIAGSELEAHLGFSAPATAGSGVSASPWRYRRCNPHLRPARQSLR